MATPEEQARVEALKASLQKPRWGKPRSGKKPGPKPRPTDPDLKLPPVGDTEEAIREYLAAVAEAVGAGRLEIRVADTCISAAKASLGALKQLNAKQEIKRLQMMLKQAKMLAQRGAQQEAADRLGQASESIEDDDDEDRDDED